MEKPKARDAIIKLSPASIVPYRPNLTFTYQDDNSIIIKLAPEVCLSGDYYFNKNLLIIDLPVCLDGRIPSMIFYENMKCVGQPKFGVDYRLQESSTTRLWNEHASKAWSLIFRCGKNPTKAQGAYHHQTAVHPQRIETPGKATNGVVVSNVSPSCMGHWSDPPIEVVVDRCFGTPGYGLQITTPAICANGTRAKWARFEDPKCNNGVLSERYGLRDILDSDIGSCFSVEKQTSKERKGSYAFWCEGLYGKLTSTPSFDEMSEAALEFLPGHQSYDSHLNSFDSSSRDNMLPNRIAATELPAHFLIGVCSLTTILSLLALFCAVETRIKRLRRQKYGSINL